MNLTAQINKTVKVAVTLCRFLPPVVMLRHCFQSQQVLCVHVIQQSRTLPVKFFFSQLQGSLLDFSGAFNIFLTSELFSTSGSEPILSVFHGLEELLFSPHLAGTIVLVILMSAEVCIFICDVRRAVNILACGVTERIHISFCWSG